MRFFWLLIFPITLLLPHSHAGLKNYLESAKIKEEIKNEIAELDIGFKVDLFDLNLAEGVGISSRYRYEVEPSYIDDWYTRIDKWVLNTDLRPGDFIKDLDLPISVNVGNGMEVVFVRQFKTRKEAMKALPYTFARLPLKAKLARSKLQPGDFVSLPANLNVMVSAGTTATDGFLSAGAHTHYLLSGAFQIHLFRMKDDKVRVKLMALRKRGLGASASADIDFKIFGIGLVDRRIKRFIGVNIADLRYDKETGNLFLMDFIFDLKDSQSRKAYNQILGSTYKFKNLKILNPFQSHKEISQQLISDLTLTEDIFKEDREKPVERRRVDRIFKGSNEFERKSKNFKLGFKLIKYSKEQAYTENQISFVDREEKKHHYFFPTHTVVKKNSFLFGFAKSSTVMNYFALWPTDKDGRSLDESRHITVSKDPLDPDGDILISKLPPLEGASGDSPDYKDFGMSMDRKDKRMWGFEQRDIKDYIRRNIPASIYNQIKWGDWAEEKKRFNGRIFFQAIIHRVGVGQLANRNRDDLKESLDAFMETVPLPKVHDSGSSKKHGPKPTWQSQNARGIRKMIKGLDEALSAEHILRDKERIQKLMELRSIDAFQELGSGFLISLLDSRSLSKHISITLHASAKDTETLDFEYGDHELKELYKELQYVQGVLNNRSFDMRLLKEEQDSAQRIGSASLSTDQGEDREGEGNEELDEGPLNEETESPDVSGLAD